MLEEKKVNELTDDDLEKVTGGSTYSKWSFAQFGVFPNREHENTEHPLIVSPFNYCSLGGNKYCYQCEYSSNLWGSTLYCDIRTKENDPLKKK